MRYDELIKALNDEKDLVWDDPDPIEGNDYTIDTVTILRGEDMDDEDICAHIEYGDGSSQATVYISEIKVK